MFILRILRPIPSFKRSTSPEFFTIHKHFSSTFKMDKSVSGPNNHLSHILHNEFQVSRPSTDNVIFSPFSLSAVLSMVKAGAAGRTAQQMKDVLRLPDNDVDLHKGFGQFLTSLKGKDGQSLSSANRLYSQQGFEIKKDFMSTLKESYGSSLEQLDFGNNVEASQKINSWIEGETNSKIKDLIAPDALDSNTKLVLVNAIYFKGLWKEKFDVEGTSTRPFALGSNNSVDVPTMSLYNKKFRTGDLEDGTRVISLPYQGDRLTMLVYLTPEGKGLTAKSPQEVLSGIYEQNVNLALPKFKLETTIQLVESLKKLGLTDLFDPNQADLSGIPESGVQLYVSKAVQKAFIEVNEEGTEAAASTGFGISLTCMPVVVDFIVDRPFFFQIVDMAHDMILFQGKVNNPLQN